MALTLQQSQLPPFFTTQLALNPKPKSFGIHCGPRSSPLVNRINPSGPIPKTGPQIHHYHRHHHHRNNYNRHKTTDTPNKILFTCHPTGAATSTTVWKYSQLLALQKHGGMGDDIDRLFEEMEGDIEGGECEFDWGDKKGLWRVLKGLIGAEKPEKRESTVRISGVMKKCGWGRGGSGVEVDEYVAKVLSKGLKRFGEVGLANEVEFMLEDYLKCLGGFRFRFSFCFGALCFVLMISWMDMVCYMD